MTGTPPPRASEALEAWVRDRVAWARRGAAAEGLERRIVWAVVAVALVLGPAVFNLARAADFPATFHLTPQEVEPFPVQTDPGFYRQSLIDPGLDYRMRIVHGVGPSEYRDATFVRDGGRIAVTVRGSSPARARRLAEFLPVEIAGSNRRYLALQRQKRIAELSVALRTDRRPGRTRLRRYQERRLLNELGGLPPPQVGLTPATTTIPAVTRPADKVADALPGEMPGRPSPFWSAVAGLMLFAVLWIVGLVVRPPSSPPAAAGAPSLARLLGPPREIPPWVEEEPAGAGGLHPALRIVWIALLVATPLATLWLITQEGENVPFYDEWTLVQLFQAHDAGLLGVSDFFRQNNEHRPAFPVAADFLTGLLTRWDLRVELYRNFAVAVATFALLTVALRRSLDRAAFPPAAVAASIVFFSPVHFENWLWGWQLEWFLSNLAAVGALWALAVTIDRSPRWGLVLAASCAVVASFSLGQGLLMWPVGLVVLLLRARPWRAWAAMGAVVYVVYFTGWEAGRSKTSAFEQPVDLVEFFLLYLGRTLGNSNATGELVGLVVLIAFLAAAVHVLRNRRDAVLVNRASIWLGLGLYVLGAAFITSVSRASDGVIAYSRYNVMAAVFVIATMALVLVVARGERVGSRTLTPKARRRVLVAVTVPLVLVALVNARSGIDSMRQRGDDLDRVAACMDRARTPADPCLRFRLIPPYAELLTWRDYLREKGWAGFR